MKRIISILLALMLAMSFAAFGAQAEEITLTFMSWGDANEKATVEAILEKFTADTGIKVEYIYAPSSEYATKLTTMAANNELPDVGYMAGGSAIQWADEGMLLDMTPILEGEDAVAKMDSCKFVDSNGNVVGIALAGESIILYYNPTYFDQMGVAYPPSTIEDAWTWEEFLDVCRQLTVDVNGKHPNEEGFDPENIKSYGIKISKSAVNYEPLLRSNGGGIYNDDFSEVIIDEPESIEVLQALADLAIKEHVAPAVGASVRSMDIASAFLSNSIAMIIDGQWNVQSLAIAAEEDGITFDVGVLPYFKTVVAGSTGDPVVVFKDTEHPEEALLLAEYMLNTEFVMSFINSGLWQPTTEDWYTDEALIDQWLTEGVHPEHYREAVIDYTYKAAQVNSMFRLGCYGQINNLIFPALDTAVLGETTAQESIDSVIEEVEKQFSEYLASIAK